MSNEKTGADLIVEKLSENKSQIESLTENVVNEFKSVGDKIALAFAETKSKEAQEEIKSLKDQIANKDNKIAALSSSGGVGLSNGEEEKKSATAFAAAIKDKSVIRLEEHKAIRITDPTTTGGFFPNVVNRGILDVNAQPLITLLDDVDVLPAVNTLKEESFFLGYDSSLLDLDEANEMDPATAKKTIEHSAIKITSRKEQASILVSTDLMLSAYAGDATALNVVEKNLDELRMKFLRKNVKKGFQDIIANANSTDLNKIVKVESTLDTVDEISMRKDLRLLPTTLKKQYVNTSILYLSRKFLNAIFAKEATDGHLPLEQFVYRDGITFFLTPEKSYVVRTFEHDQIGDYLSLKDGTTSITTDYNPSASAGGNAGKLLAIVGDFKKGYKYQPSIAGTIGYDNSVREQLTGVVVAGMISYVAQGLGVRESLKVLYSK